MAEDDDEVATAWYENITTARHKAASITWWQGVVQGTLNTIKGSGPTSRQCDAANRLGRKLGVHHYRRDREAFISAVVEFDKFCEQVDCSAGKWTVVNHINRDQAGPGRQQSHISLALPAEEGALGPVIVTADDGGAELPLTGSADGLPHVNPLALDGEERIDRESLEETEELTEDERHKGEESSRVSRYESPQITPVAYKDDIWLEDWIDWAEKDG